MIKVLARCLRLMHNNTHLDQSFLASYMVRYSRNRAFVRVSSFGYVILRVFGIQDSKGLQTQRCVFAERNVSFIGLRQEDMFSTYQVLCTRSRDHTGVRSLKNHASNIKGTYPTCGVRIRTRVLSPLNFQSSGRALHLRDRVRPTVR